MNLRIAEKRTVALASLTHGDIFAYRGEIYMVATPDIKWRNAMTTVRLKDGHIGISADQPKKIKVGEQVNPDVHHLDVELVVYNKIEGVTE